MNNYKVEDNKIILTVPVKKITKDTKKELEKRIRGRNTEPEEIVQQRLAKANREMEMIGQYKYVVCNEDPKLAADIIRVIIKRHMETTESNA